jgi:hypothetical protein
VTEISFFLSIYYPKTIILSFHSPRKDFEDRLIFVEQMVLPFFTHAIILFIRSHEVAEADGSSVV